MQLSTRVLKTDQKLNKKNSTQEKGATMVEYALMVALILAICVTSITTIGRRSSSAFSQVASSMAN